MCIERKHICSAYYLVPDKWQIKTGFENNGLMYHYIDLIHPEKYNTLMIIQKLFNEAIIN